MRLYGGAVLKTSSSGCVSGEAISIMMPVVNLGESKHPENTFRKKHDFSFLFSVSCLESQMRGLGRHDVCGLLHRSYTQDTVSI